MENYGFKGLLVSIWQRVFLSYQTTLIGIAVIAIGVVADYYVTSPNKLVSLVAGVIGSVLVFIKQKYPAPTPTPLPPPPAP